MTSNITWQMTPDGFREVYVIHGTSQAKTWMKGSGDIGKILNPLSNLVDSSTTSDAGWFDPGGKLNHMLDPGDLFGGNEKALAQQAQKDLPGQLSALNQLQANVSRYDTNGPFGTSKWSIDPETGRYTQTTQLAPSEQRQFDARNQIANTMMDKAGQFAPASSSSFDYGSEVPALANAQLSKVSSLTSPVTNNLTSDWQAKMANAGISPTSDAFKEVAAQRAQDAAANQFQQKSAATTAAIPLAQQQRQQRMTELATLLGGQQLNSPALGGNGVDIGGATAAANQAGINNANQSAAQRNANMQSLAGLMQLAYPNGFG